MTRGRHRQPPSRHVLLLALGVGVLVTVIVSALPSHSTTVLRLALCFAGAAAVALAGLVWRRDGQHARAMAVETSGRRRDQAQLHGQLGELRETLAGLRSQLERRTIESSELRRQIDALCSAKEDAEETLRQLRNEHAEPHGLQHGAQGPGARQQDAQGHRAAEPAGPLASGTPAAAALEAFELGRSGDEEDWISSWVSGLFDDEGDLVIDLTMPVETCPLNVRLARNG